MNYENHILKHIDFVLVDTISLILSFIVSYYLKNSDVKIFYNDNYIELIFVIVIIQILVCFFYEPFKNVMYRGYLVELKTTIVFDLLSFLLLVCFLFVTKRSSIYSRIILVSTYTTYLLLSYITRILLKNYLIKKASKSIKTGTKSLLIICKSSEINKIVEQIIKNNFSYYRICAICVIDKKTNNKIDGIKVIEKSKILNYVSTNWVDNILIFEDANKLSKDLLEGLIKTNIPLHFKLNTIGIIDNETQVLNKMCGYYVLTSARNVRSNYQIFVKRFADMIGGAVGCLLTLIIMVFIAPIIYIKSPGPIIYKSNRVGKNGKVFKFYKFRSMVNNADDLKKELIMNNRIKDGMMFKIEDDPRIIPGIGSFIRKTSIDEFPQFFNVLKGDMSLVGTRPPTIDEWEKYSPYYRSRLSIKPGITGLWQISGRSNITNFDEVVQLDNEYINNFSISLDIKILAKTVIQLFSKSSNGAM